MKTLSKKVKAATNEELITMYTTIVNCKSGIKKEMIPSLTLSRELNKRKITIN